MNMLLDNYCPYCGDFCEGKFCSEAHEYLFYDEEELMERDEKPEFDEDKAELERFIREEMKTRTGEIPMFKGERP